MRSHAVNEDVVPNYMFDSWLRIPYSIGTLREKTSKIRCPSRFPNKEDQAFDLKSAYHQLHLLEEEKHVTAFEANGELWQFNQLLFGLTNGVPASQKAISPIVDGLEGIAVYIDDVVIGGATEAEHDKSLAEFWFCAQSYNLTINEEKSKFKNRELKFLGLRFSDGKVHPDVSRKKPLLEILVPTTLKEIDRFVAMSVHWVGDFVIIAAPWLKAKREKKLALDTEARKSIETIKRAVSKAALWIPDRTKPFVLKTDASGNAISAVPTQTGQPVAFVSHELSDQVFKWSAIEKNNNLPLGGLYKDVDSSC